MRKYTKFVCVSILAVFLLLVSCKLIFGTKNTEAISEKQVTGIIREIAGANPINTEVYDSEMDREYKETFLQMLFNQISIQYEEQGEIYYRESDNRFSGWDLLGSGKLYYIDSTVATLWYGYQEINASGEQTIEIGFTVVSGHDYDEYEVSVDDSQDVTLSEDEWNEITQEYFEAIDNAPIGMTFEELFGDVEYPYNNGKDIVLEDEVYLQENLFSVFRDSTSQS